jgi:hypothetical protein
MEVENVNTESVNETTTNNVDVIEKSGGDSPASFDDLSNAHASAERKAQLEPNAQKAVEKVKAKATAKTDKKEVNEEPTEEVAAEELPKVRMFKVKNGHDSLDLRSDMEVPVKIDGVETMVSLSDLRDGYAGQSTVQERFKELASNRNTYEADRAALDNFVGDVFQDVEQDPMAAMIKIAERAGLDPVKYQMSLLDALSEHAEKWQGMSEEEREIYRYDLENQQLKNRLDRSESQNQYAQQRAQVDSRVSELSRELGIGREEFAQNYFDVEEYFKSEGLDANEITPEIVAEYIVDQHNENEASEILKSISPDLAEDWDAVNTLMGVAADNPDLTDEDLREIAQEAWGVDRKAEKVTRKVQKGKPDIVKDTVPRNAEKSPLSFDDLESML